MPREISLKTLIISILMFFGLANANELESSKTKISSTNYKLIEIKSGSKFLFLCGGSENILAVNKERYIELLSQTNAKKGGAVLLLEVADELVRKSGNINLLSSIEVDSSNYESIHAYFLAQNVFLKAIKTGAAEFKYNGKIQPSIFVNNYIVNFVDPKHGKQMLHQVEFSLTQHGNSLECEFSGI